MRVNSEKSERAMQAHGLADDADTIVAVSTAMGLGAIGIVRLSGPSAFPIALGVFRPARGYPLRVEESHRLLYGHVVHPESGDVVDEVLLAWMRAPRTYTREDVIELHCHGGIAAQRAVLRLVVARGARLAEPGEFTRRAFVNGRIDLAQAESVAAIVGARSTGALRASVRQLGGGLSERLQDLRKDLVSSLAVIEATVDFSDEDVEDLEWGAVAENLAGVEEGLARLLRTAFVGRALEQGLRTAIVGKPNVGKSSLLNALLMRERAIVSDVPGTTRDTVEELMEIGGIPIHLVDTAGLRGVAIGWSGLGSRAHCRPCKKLISYSWSSICQRAVTRTMVGCRRIWTLLARSSSATSWISCSKTQRRNTSEGHRARCATLPRRNLKATAGKGAG
jgi:tRNA modification GTPase